MWITLLEAMREERPIRGNAQLTMFLLLLVWLVLLFFPLESPLCEEQQLTEAASNSIEMPARLGMDIRRIPPDTLRTVSLGRPSGHRLVWGTIGGYRFDRDLLLSRLFIDDHTQLALPQFGVLDLTFEGAVVGSGETFGGALGTYVRLLGVRQGVEWNLAEKDFFIRLSMDVEWKRGGLFGIRDRLRLDYVPAMKAIQVGLVLDPFWIRYRQNRPKSTHVKLEETELPGPVPADSTLIPREELGRIEHAMQWIDRLLTPKLAFDIINSKRERRKFEQLVQSIHRHVQQQGHSFMEEDSAYHAALVTTFTHASGGDVILGKELALKTEQLLLEEVIIPFNRLFGQKKKPFQLGGFIRRASQAFDHYIDFEINFLDSMHRNAAKEVFRFVLLNVNEVANTAKRRWKDDRLVWLPLNYGLQREQYDSQNELNQIVERVVGRKFTHANNVRYLLNEQWYYQLERMILETEFYHVLIIHDFRGFEGKEIDRIGWNLVINGYLEAFISAIQAMDRGERSRLPEFMIFLDEHYYQINKSGRIMNFLENLYEPGKISLKDKEVESALRSAHEKLLKTIATSKALQGKSKEYLREKIKVHINITNVYRPAFAGDAPFRDHRKIAFRDIFEDDPSLGVAIFTGQGVGEHYLGPCWEDRSIMVQGPDLIHLKTATRILFMSQGYESQEAPYYLQPRDFPENYDEMCEDLRKKGWTASVITVMNAIGYGDKAASVLKAVLYNLILPGSVIIAPDSLWSSDFWAGMFVGEALRGCSVYPIAPASSHAPSSGLPTMELVRNTLSSMLSASQILSDAIKKAGGSLTVGLYTCDNDVNDLKATLAAFIDGVQRNEHLKIRFKVHPEIIRAIYEEYDRLSQLQSETKHLVIPKHDCKPTLHSKTQFFISSKGLDILSREEWQTVLKEYFKIRQAEVSGDFYKVEGITPRLLKTADLTAAKHQDLITAYTESMNALPPEERESAIFILTVGSHNQDRRSMFLDGETVVAVSGYESLIGIIDFALLMGTTRWVYSIEGIEQMFPKKQSLIRSIAIWIKDLI